ncbi:MAG: twin-arginine translocase TatA/TatE family subunit [Bacteroidota bacterium]
MPFIRDFGLPELLIILVIVILLFGPGRLGKIAGELGKGIRSFREGISGNKDEETKTTEEKKDES